LNGYRKRSQDYNRRWRQEAKKARALEVEPGELVED
jgi:hypothetical protein